MNRTRRIVLLAALALFAAWAVGNFGRITGDEEGAIRFSLGFLFAIIILLRPKRPRTHYRRAGALLPAVGAIGAVLAVLGMVFDVHQFEWLGLILVLFVCLRWALPTRYGPDILLSLFLLYWIHPMPGQLFGRFQLAMQWLSTEGSEWLLQCVNTRVWADGFILHTGFYTFGIPEACSGMRTAVTVFLCTLGVGIIFRFRWYTLLVFLVLGLAQVLVLNIIRISAMVYLAPRMPPQWSDTFLHDSLGVFLLITILLVQAEASWWKISSERRRQRRDGIERGEIDRPDKASTLPRIWRLGLRWGPLTVLVLLLLGAAAGAVYRSRPSHQAEMIAGTVEELAERSPETAERAIAAALALSPGSRDMQSERAKVLLRREKYAEALDQFNALSGNLSLQETVMKSATLMRLGRSEDAIALIDALPEKNRAAPGVAMLSAEYAAMKNRPDEVARNVALAARTHLLIRRVRALFPYLAAHAQWRTIAECGSHVPHTELLPALLEVHAKLRMNDLSGSMEILKPALRRWPQEPRFLSGLFTVASRDESGEWEGLFEKALLRNLDGMTADGLATAITQCFQLRRPDLAWRAYILLRRLDPRDPSLLFAPAQFGNVWLMYGRHRAGLEADSRAETVDLSGLLRQMARTDSVGSMMDLIPLARELSQVSEEEMRLKYLDRGIRELERREGEGTLTGRMEMMFPVALGMDARYEEAHERLDRIAEKYPDRRERAIFQHAVFYDQEDRWEEAYEALREYVEIASPPDLMSRLMMIQSLMNMNMGVSAMEVIQEARQAFPGAAELDTAEASVWDAFGYHEQALFMLLRNPQTRQTLPVVRLLYRTGRYEEAEGLGKVLGVRRRVKAARREQPFSLPPAELEITPRWPASLDGEQMKGEAENLEKTMAAIKSPFLRELYGAVLEWYRAGGTPEVSDPEAWSLIGRDRLERGAALHRLASLLARQQDYVAAGEAVLRALDLMPGSPVLNRIRVAIAEGDRKAVDEARAACPDDPGIWLAALIVRAREDNQEEWIENEVRETVESKRFPPATMVRAAEFLLRKRMLEAAAIAARDGTDRGSGLLAAHVIGLRCAVQTKNASWALSCALNGAEMAVDPSPFYKSLVHVKELDGETDTDMIAALEYLAERFPSQTEWAERLGQVYFQKKDPRRALGVLESILESKPSGVGVQSMLLAAESARVQGDIKKAVRILETAYRVHPDRVDVLNNLIYCLAYGREGLARARTLLPLLLERSEESWIFLDTAALVYLKSGELDLAQQYMRRALNVLERGEYSTLEVEMNAAEILFRLGESDRAWAKVNAIRKNSERSDMIDRRATQLMRRLRETTGKRE
ncbi:MAG: archaeosortase/exosortase family protein [Lentisphaerae bacterium]|nr:archaeosortase/exosortase family protein [Lentisphaerota bacterium]